LTQNSYSPTFDHSCTIKFESHILENQSVDTLNNWPSRRFVSSQQVVYMWCMVCVSTKSADVQKTNEWHLAKWQDVWQCYHSNDKSCPGKETFGHIAVTSKSNLSCLMFVIFHVMCFYFYHLQN